VVVALLVTAVPLAAQRGWDAQAVTLGLVRDSSALAAGLGTGVRFGRGMRAALTLTAGWQAPDAVMGRAEATVAYHLYPARPGRPGWYLGGGVATELSRGDLRGLVLALLGVEARPWRRGGIFAELGVGGGLRLAVGYRSIRLARRP